MAKAKKTKTLNKNHRLKHQRWAEKNLKTDFQGFYGVMKWEWALMGHVAESRMGTGCDSKSAGGKVVEGYWYCYHYGWVLSSSNGTGNISEDYDLYAGQYSITCIRVVHCWISQQRPQRWTAFGRLLVLLHQKVAVKSLRNWLHGWQANGQYWREGCLYWSFKILRMSSLFVENLSSLITAEKYILTCNCVHSEHTVCNLNWGLCY